jgi:hypothetical protein
VEGLTKRIKETKRKYWKNRDKLRRYDEWRRDS